MISHFFTISAISASAGVTYIAFYLFSFLLTKLSQAEPVCMYLIINKILFKQTEPCVLKHYRPLLVLQSLITKCEPFYVTSTTQVSEPEFYGDLVHKFSKIFGKNDFPYHFKKIIVRYKKIGYNIDVLRQTACLVVNPTKVNTFAYLFNCTTVGRAFLNDGTILNLTYE